jgi:serine/threonine-protein kinase
MDAELNREVALKEIQERFADQPSARSRFLREADVTGNLEHPGIVPVYSVGCHADGRPFYAMRFIRGESMQDTIRRFHAPQAQGLQPQAQGLQPLGFHSLEFRDLLGRFVTVCNTIAYAHARGVLHRDVKPANVMLGPFGETLVVDWGLARLLEEPDAERTTADRPIVAGASLRESATEMGQVIGTPAYMPPEQAEGILDRMGPQSDVFALGATLYSLLTGQPPYHGDDALGQARRAEWVPARQRNRSVPAALDAICRKAMARRPEDRYASARDLSEEVQRYLADEPVAAHAEPLTDRVRRWGRRHRGAVIAAVVLLLAGVVGLSVGLWAVERQRGYTLEALDTARVNLQRAEKAEQEAKANLLKSDENLKLARRAIDECFNVAWKHPLFQTPRMEKAKKLLLEKTLPFYKQVRFRRPDDRGLQREEGEQWFRVGYIEHVLGRVQEGLTAFRQAESIRRELVKARPDSPEYQNDLASTYNSIAILLTELGRHEEAVRQYQQARDHFLELLKAYPDVAVVKEYLGTARNNIALPLSSLGKDEEALKEVRQALAIRSELATAHPDEPKYRNDLAATHDHLGVLLYYLGRSEEALKEYRRAEAICLELVALDPDEPEYRRELAQVHNNLGTLLRDLERRQEALVAFEKSRDCFSVLAKSNPDVPRYQDLLAGVHVNLGIVLSDLRKRPEALSQFQEARDIRARLVKANPNVPGYLHGLISTYTRSAPLLERLGKHDEAVKEYRVRLDAQAQLARLQPDLKEHRDHLAGWHNDLGVRLKELGKIGEATKEYLAARDVSAGLVKAYPGEPEYQNTLASTISNLGLLLSEQGKPEEALKEYQQALDITAKLAKGHPQAANYQNTLAVTHNNVGLLLADLGKRAEALKHFEQARQVASGAVKDHPGNLPCQVTLAGTYCNVGNLTRNDGQAKESLTHYDQAIAMLRALGQRSISDNPARSFLRNSHWGRADALGKLRRYREAAVDWDQASRLNTTGNRAYFRSRQAWALAKAGDHGEALRQAKQLDALPGLTEGDRYDLACVYAVAAQAAAQDGARPLPERTKSAEQSAQSAVARLRRAAAGGYFREPSALADLDRDSDLAFLREREDYRRFRGELKPVK